MRRSSASTTIPRTNKIFTFRLLLALLSGVLLTLSFPTYDLWPLAWISLVPLLFALRASGGVPKREAFLLGWAAGTIHFASTIYWVTISMIDFGGMRPLVAYPLMLLLAAYLGLYPALFSIAMVRLPWAAAPFLWTALELARGRLLTGFPWALIGYSQYRNLTLIQIADIGGVYLVGFIVVLVNAALASVIVQRRRRAVTAPLTWVALSLLLATLLYGRARLAEPYGAEQLRVAVIQGNIPQERKWDDQYRREAIDIYSRLTRGFAGSDLVVWPETAAPFFFEAESRWREELINLARRERVPLLFGSPAMRIIPDQKPVLLNSAYLISPLDEGVKIARYDKIHLVPFGEYVPIKALLFFVDKMAEGIGDFIPGSQIVVLEGAKEKVGVVICFEVIFPELVRQFVLQGARVMTTITNDAWFGRSAGPYQHFSMAVFRAVENRVPFARAANSGISGLIDPYGRVLVQTELFTEATASATLRSAGRPALYPRIGDLFAWACAIIALVGTAFRFKGERSG